MSNIAKDTPSGYDANNLISMVNRPQPIPNITFPRGSIGDVT